MKKAPVAPFSLHLVVDTVREILLTASKDHYLYRSENQLNVVKNAVRFKVLKVIFEALDILGNRVRIAHVDLTDRGNAWFNRQQALEVVRSRLHEHVYIIFVQRAWANDGHFAFQHIDKLRKLVQTRFAQDTAYRCDTRIVIALGVLQTHFICVYTHAAEFVDVEHFAPTS